MPRGALSRRGIIKRILPVAVVLCLIWGICVMVAIHRFGETGEPPQADCIIVLGAAVHDGKPSPVFAERINHGIGLFRRGKAAKIIFTGGFGDHEKIPESKAASDTATAAGIPQEAILIEEHSQTTKGNLAEVLKLMKAGSMRSAIIVSDPYHLMRSCRIASDLGIRAYPSATPISRYRSFRAKAGFLLRELYFNHHYWATGN